MSFDDSLTTRVDANAPPRIFSVALTVIDGPSRGRRVDVARGAARLGSSSGADLVLDDPTVSRLHCEVRVRARGVSVRDLGSTNGTFSSGIRLREAELPPGAVLRLGQSAVRVDVGADDVFDEVASGSSFGELLGASLPMRRLYALLARVAPSDATLLVRGETGSGKEVLARSVHAASPRRAGPFVAVDCGAIPEQLFESEMFGHVRGAFTGAIADRMGAFEEAHRGTLFLDEIGELPLSSQAKLLRAIETRTLRRVGAPGTRAVDVRIVAATHRRLDEAVNTGGFREDLYYRLAQVEAHLPPLREREGDVALLARQFFRARGGQGEPPAELLASLARRSFPGNVRELRHVVARALLLGTIGRGGPASPVALAAPVDVPAIDVPALHLPIKAAREAWIEQFELIYARNVLARAGGNVTHAAELAGTNRRHLQRIVARLGLDPRSLSGIEDEGDPPGG